jgi:hypothetical protein
MGPATSGIVSSLLESARDQPLINHQRRIDRVKYCLQLRLEHLANPMRQGFVRDR